MNNLRRSLAVVALSVPMLAFLPLNTAALTTVNGNGKAVHSQSLSGSVINADQGRHSITLSWWHKWTNKHGTNRTESLQASFKVADGVVFKNGSWSNIVKGVKVVITGQGDLVEQIEISK